VEIANQTGAKLVILTFKESLRFPAPGSHGERSVYTDFNEVLEQMPPRASWATRRSPTGTVLLLAAVVVPTDGIHTNLVGTLALGWFLSMTIAALVDNPCPFDNSYPCTVPAIDDGSIDWLQMFGVENTDIQCYEDGPGRKRVCELDRRMS